MGVGSVVLPLTLFLAPWWNSPFLQKSLMTVHPTNLRRKYSPQSTLDIDEHDNQTWKVSLWLLPKDDQAWQDEIDRLASLHPDSEGINFAPHVTLAGGISILPEKVPHLLQTLRQGMAGWGTVECELAKNNKNNNKSNTTTSSSSSSSSSSPVSVNPNQWNQAAVAVVEPTPDLIQLCQLSRKLMDLHDTSCLFAPPLREPHMSLYYGTRGVPTVDDIQLPATRFVADRVALWKTSPSNNEQDVAQSWQQLDIISLMDHHHDDDDDDACNSQKEFV